MSGAAMAQSAAPAASTSPAAVAPVAAKGDLIETAKASGQLTTFVKAIDAANLTSVLKTNPNLTVFAPTDAAFAALPAGELDRLMKDPTALQKVLTYHVINARVDSSKIIGSKGPVKTVEGDSVVLDGSGATAMVDGARITQADVMATNGVLHLVDKVLMPGAMAQAAAAIDTATSADVSANTTTAAATAVPGATDSAPMGAAMMDGATTTPSASTAAVDTTAATPVSSMSSDAQAGLKAGDPNVTSNAPVADTPENRAKYGKPVSNAGKRSAAKGN
ncbi:fasciclin domain-containing protein [Caulobacter sp. B11]|uniref:fasciclin domain-containing protein n=1 Tax=Caulobacter sp. B11 TaxID=2048899 RepID=UPI001F367220|nr:fasciclin domain-containing protein [Caulobacter sp. B11]